LSVVPLPVPKILTAAAEKSRICAAGGFVDFGRVNGNLALSRAIGDFEFKKSAELPPEQQIVTAFPDVSEHDITDDDEFLVVACDGTDPCSIPSPKYAPANTAL
jgi:protein phosphatase 2C family protein 2/3